MTNNPYEIELRGHTYDMSNLSEFTLMAAAKVLGGEEIPEDTDSPEHKAWAEGFINRMGEPDIQRQTAFMLTQLLEDCDPSIAIYETTQKADGDIGIKFRMGITALELYQVFDLLLPIINARESEYAAIETKEKKASGFKTTAKKTTRKAAAR